MDLQDYVITLGLVLVTVLCGHEAAEGSKYLGKLMHMSDVKDALNNMFFLSIMFIL